MKACLWLILIRNPYEQFHDATPRLATNGRAGGLAPPWLLREGQATFDQRFLQAVQFLEESVLVTLSLEIIQLLGRQMAF